MDGIIILMKVSTKTLLVIMAVFLLAAPVNAQGIPQITGSTFITRIAPGELVPITVKLTNFGTYERADVQIFYQMTDANGNAVISENETVAVETSATFSKVIQIPFQTKSGQYTIRASAYYPDQVAPAHASISIDVERKIFGLFIGEFKEYSLYIGLFLILFFSLLYILFKKQGGSSKKNRYANVSHRLRLFYEIIDEMVSQAKEEIGEKAMEIANRVEDLKINKDGKVISIDGDPSEIIKKLTSLYEEELGVKIKRSPIKD